MDIACCVDVLEHVDDVDAVIAETARVLRTGGVYVFDTINRTGLSRLVVIKVLQEWRLTAWMPPNLHAWEQFITPDELRAVMSRHHLECRDVVGIGPGVKPHRLMRLLWQLRTRRISHGEFGHQALRPDEGRACLIRGVRNQGDMTPSWPVPVEAVEIAVIPRAILSGHRRHSAARRRPPHGASRLCNPTLMCLRLARRPWRQVDLRGSRGE